MRIERDGEVALIRLENGKGNAIGPSFLDRLESLLGQLGEARAAVITGQGSAFSTGLGLNATKLGIGLPALVVETLRWQVPGPSLAALALEGRLVSPREAVQLGVLHELAPEAELLPRALQRASSLAALPPAGIRMVKESLRRPAA